MHNLIHSSGLSHSFHPALLTLAQPTTPASLALDLEVTTTVYSRHDADDVTGTLDPEPDMLRAFAAVMSIAEHSPGLEPLETLGQNLGLRQIRHRHDGVGRDTAILGPGPGPGSGLGRFIGGEGVAEFVAFGGFHVSSL